MQNGTRKGGAPEPMQTILSSPGFEDLWQKHWSYNAMLEQNSPALFIANVEDMTTIAGVLTAPPRGAGPGRGGASAAQPSAPPAASPATPGAAPPSATTQVPTGANATPPPGGAATAGPAPQGGGGRGRGNATGHTPAYWLKVAAYSDGTFTITNPRNGFDKTYEPRTPQRPTK
jgi:hypothetical protein